MPDWLAHACLVHVLSAPCHGHRFLRPAPASAGVHGSNGLPPSALSVAIAEVDGSLVDMKGGSFASPLSRFWLIVVECRSALDCMGRMVDLP